MCISHLPPGKQIVLFKNKAKKSNQSTDSRKTDIKRIERVIGEKGNDNSRKRKLWVGTVAVVDSSEHPSSHG